MTPLIRRPARAYHRARNAGPIGLGPVAFVAALLALGMLAEAGPVTGFAADPVYKKMVRINAGLRSSVADIEVHTKVKSFPPMSLTFKGKSYFKAPDKQKVVFENVPSMMKGMVKDSPTIEPAPLWPRYYSVRVEKAAGGYTIFHLTSTNDAEPVASADVTVDGRTGLISRFAQTNRNGSTVVNDLTYMRQGGMTVVASQQGSAQGKGYKADVTTTFSNYRINVPVDDALFLDSE